jgi:site-specific recombinase XerD
MNKKYNGPNHCTTCDDIKAQIDPFIACLETAGYAANTICTKRAALRRFLVWKQRLKSRLGETDESEVAEFMATSSQLAPRRRGLASTALLLFLKHLRQQKVITTRIPEAPPTVSTMMEKRYAEFLRDEKGLAEWTVRVYLPLVPKLFDYLGKQHGTNSIRRLDASKLRAFLLKEAQGKSSEYVRSLASSLRSFLRYLHAVGDIPHDLSAAIPSVSRRTQPDVPKRLTAEEVDRVLATPDRTTATGRRDVAILLLLAKLGLRAGEVLALELGDIHWRTGEILVRGKGGRLDLLPMPQDVGTAIARYLRLDRGVRPTRRVFLRTHAPRVPFSASMSIGHIVCRVMVKANVERPKHIAAHLFRHSLASRMLQQGANLRDIAEVLRHRGISATEIYAKIDMRSLDDVVRPWPAQGGAR